MAHFQNISIWKTELKHFAYYNNDLRTTIRRGERRMEEAYNVPRVKPWFFPSICWTRTSFRLLMHDCAFENYSYVIEEKWKISKYFVQDLSSDFHQYLHHFLFVKVEEYLNRYFCRWEREHNSFWDSSMSALVIIRMHGLPWSLPLKFYWRFYQFQQLFPPCYCLTVAKLVKVLSHKNSRDSFCSSEIFL